MRRSDKIHGYLLDSHALLAFFEKEAGGEHVRDLLLQAEEKLITLHLSLINWGEILYITKRGKGKEASEDILSRIEAFPISIEPVSQEVVKAAAEIKAEHPIAYADAFAAATAQRLQMPIVTGDPEFKRLGTLVQISWTIQQKR